MSRKKREEEREILRQMLDCDRDAGSEDEKPVDTDNSSEDDIYCPRCRNKLKNRNASCPYCGYSGYIPMSEQQTVHIKRILYPLILVAAVVIFLWAKGYFG